MGHSRLIHHDGCRAARDAASFPILAEPGLQFALFVGLFSNFLETMT